MNDKHLLKKIITICMFCLNLSVAVLLTGCGNNNSIDNTLNDTPLSKISGKDIDGNELNSNVFSNNEVTMINIWGTFCGPCIKEMPDLQHLSEKYKNKSFQIIGMPADIYYSDGTINANKYSEAKQILTKTGVNYSQIIVDKAFYEEVLKNIQNVPVTIFVNSDGKQIGTQYVGAKKCDEWEYIIDKLLE